MQSLSNYVLVTPARNEAEFIELTLKSVVAQTIRPLKWVIVSDGSTDATDEIVSRYTADYHWIELVRLPERRDRHFAGKVTAFNAGFERVKTLKYDAVASLDADLSFDDDYFEFLLSKLTSDPALGLVGTPFKDTESRETYDYRFVNIEHVSGACQLFRRACFEDVGGYVPVKGGGIDYIAVVTARLKGWKTRTFIEKFTWHHRNLGTAQVGKLRAKFNYGRKDYVLGNHPIWEIFRAMYQMTQRPFATGGLMMASGYLWAAIRRTSRPVPSELVDFVRREQMCRLAAFVRRLPQFGSGQQAGKECVVERATETSLHRDTGAAL